MATVLKVMAVEEKGTAAAGALLKSWVAAPGEADVIIGMKRRDRAPPWIER